MSKERPILFSAPMVRALLDGRKTQTRRIIKKVNGIGSVTQFGRSDTQGYDWCMRNARMCWNDFKSAELLDLCPHGKTGDRLWVRETFNYNGKHYIYAADLNSNGVQKWAATWRPSIHMPRIASRIMLGITGVRVERLQDISEEYAIAEGCNPAIVGSDLEHLKYRAGYQALWESINGTGSWDLNPWVWVIDFKRINEEQTGGNNNPEHRQESARKRRASVPAADK